MPQGLRSGGGWGEVVSCRYDLRDGPGGGLAGGRGRGMGWGAGWCASHINASVFHLNKAIVAKAQHLVLGCLKSLLPFESAIFVPRCTHAF